MRSPRSILRRILTNCVVDATFCATEPYCADNLILPLRRREGSVAGKVTLDWGGHSP